MAPLTRAALLQVRASKKLKDLVTLMLVIGMSLIRRTIRRWARLHNDLRAGNYMNCSVKNGACVSGFKIGFLTQLGNTKTVDNSVSLLHYLADVWHTVGIPASLPCPYSLTCRCAHLPVCP